MLEFELYEFLMQIDHTVGIKTTGASSKNFADFVGEHYRFDLINTCYGSFV